jgi:bacillithiol synthase
MNGSPTLQVLPFRKIPHQLEMFLRYVEFAPDALRFYDRPPTFEALEESVAEVRSGVFDRRQVAEILGRQNEIFGSDESARDAIENLARPDSVAIVTGQQVGLCTVPALAIYKALTAIHLSAGLRRRGVNAVAVFWMASDDHDLAEVSRLTIPTTSGGLEVWDTREELWGSKELPPRPVGSIQLPESVRKVLNIYCDSLGIPAKSAIRIQLETACRPGNTFAEAFGRLMAQLLQGKGLILFDPRDAEAKKLAARVVIRALAESNELRGHVRERSAALRAAGFSPQVAVLPKSTLVFMEELGERRLITADGSRFTLKGTGKEFSPEEMLRIAGRAPECLSPNVLLRPVVQDHLFPTVAYVGGPAEVSYFAQVEPLYRFFGRPMPVIWPRSSLTVLDARSGATMERFSLTLEDSFRGDFHLLGKMLERRPPDFESPLARIRDLADRGLEELKPELALVDRTLESATETVRRKLLFRVQSLRRKFLNSELRTNSPLGNEIRSLLNDSYPHENLQEREHGIHYLLSRHGPSLLDILYDRLEPESFTHKIFTL